MSQASSDGSLSQGVSIQKSVDNQQREALILARGVAPPTGDPSSADCLIEAQGIGKAYDLFDTPGQRLSRMFGLGRPPRTFDALRGVSFELRRGEAFGIIGRNGSGKSTLLQILAGTLQPTTGWARVRGRVAALLELGSGFNPEFSGRENVYLNGAILGFNEDELDRRFDAIAAFADIGDFVDQPVKLYSSGMYVRLAFAVQASLSPDILIVDEALSVGDVFFQQKCMLRIRELLDGGTAVLMVTHDLNTVSKFCDRVLLLSEGRVADDGDPKQVLEHYIAMTHGAPLDRTSGQDAGADDDNRLPPIPADAPRHGDGGARITGCAIRAAGVARHEFHPGEHARIEIEIETCEPGLTPNIGLQILDRFGHKACSTNMLMQACPPPVLPVGGRLRACFDIALMTGEGSYTLSLAVSTNELQPVRIFDWVDQATQLRVIPRPDDSVSGFAHCPTTVTVSIPT